VPNNTYRLKFEIKMRDCMEWRFHASKTNADIKPENVLITVNMVETKKMAEEAILAVKTGALPRNAICSSKKCFEKVRIENEGQL
jgi:hypothetical protein